MLSLILPRFLSVLSLLPGFERELRLLPLLVQSGGTVIDIGASNGIYSLPLAVLVGRAGSVVAVEPRRSAARRLAWLSRRLNLAHLHVRRAALAAIAGPMTVVVPRRRFAVPGRSFIQPAAAGTATLELDDGLRSSEPEQCWATTLDQVAVRSGRVVDFLKCDVEGAEQLVMAGGHEVLSTHRPVILCEVEDRHSQRFGSSRDEFLDQMEHHGYVDLSDATAAVDARNVLLVPHERSAALRTLLANHHS